MTARAVLTDPRKQALALLAEYHYLTTPDFYALLGRSNEHERRGVRRMLMLLARAGLVVRSRYTIDRPDDPFLRYQHCYRLSRAGMAAIGRGQAAIEKSPASLAHELGITAFHIALATALPPTHRLYWRQSDLKRSVNPDALFALTDTTKPRESSTLYYFLEVERSRQGHYRGGESGLIAKLRRYTDYRRTERCRRDWQHFSDFRVIVVLANVERRENLLRVLGARLPDRAIWTTAQEDIERNVHGAIFYAPSNPNVHSLFVGETGETHV